MLALLMFVVVVGVLLIGFPVAFSLAGVALLFAIAGITTGIFDASFLDAAPNRIFGIMTNGTLVAVPLFVFMGVTLERAHIAEDLLDTLGMLFGRLRGGLGIAVTLVGMLLAASTGIVGATVVTMGLLSLPTMLKRGYDPAVATGVICASGTLGQIIPPSIVLVLLGDVLSSSFQQAQISQGIFSPETVSVGDLFIGAVIPGFLLVVFYIVYLILLGLLRPETMPRPSKDANDRITGLDLLIRVVLALLPPLMLILAVLGSIIAGFATPTEAAAVGALGALVLALIRRELSMPRLQEIVRRTTKITAMVFMILIGASVFSLVFRGYGGDQVVGDFLIALPGGTTSAVIIVMLVMFLLGFVLDFIEITFVVVPIVGPILLAMGLDPVWLGIMIAINLQTSFLTPPFGFALFYLRGVAPEEVATSAIYRGSIPFVAIQLMMLVLLAVWPELVTWLPEKIYG